MRHPVLDGGQRVDREGKARACWNVINQKGSFDVRAPRLAKYDTAPFGERAKQRDQGLFTKHNARPTPVHARTPAARNTGALQ